MAWVGMNPEQVKAQKQELETQAGAIQKLIGKIEAEVNTIKSNWNGDDSEKFEKEWSGTHRPELEKAKKLLDTMAEKVQQELTEQNTTSTTY